MRDRGVTRCCLTAASLSLLKFDRRENLLRESGQQIVTARPGDRFGHKLSNWLWFRQNYAGINIRGICLSSRDQWLVDQQFQFATDFFARDLVRNRLLERHRRTKACVFDFHRDLVWHLTRP